MKLSSEDVIRIAKEYGLSQPCKECSIFASLGWESFPSLSNDSGLIKAGSLWLCDENEPTLDEFHPDKTNYWSASAPIALDFHPYNRCELWQCRVCRYPFLRYTEYGGYYEDRRIRALNPKLIA